MDTSKLISIKRRSKKRLGRGHGSGKVKTSGRGTKGQKARDSITPGFEGGQLSLLKRLPLLRGKGRNKALQAKTVAVSLEKLELLPEGSKVTLEILSKYHMIDTGVSRVKILGNGTLNRKLTVSVACSKSARRAIEKAGGTVAV
jgi:large subunit ribosomal protein L15